MRKYRSADAIKRYIDGNAIPEEISKTRCRQALVNSERETVYSMILREPATSYYDPSVYYIYIHSLYMEPYHNCLSNVLFYHDSSPRSLIGEYRRCRCRSIKFRVLTGVTKSGGDKNKFFYSDIFRQERDRAAYRSCEMKNARKWNELWDASSGATYIHNVRFGTCE